MKKTLLTLLTAAVLAMALPAASQAGGVKLTYANFFPPTHIQSQLAQQWCDEVAKRTDGAVKIDYFPGGTLAKAPQTYDGVVEGIADIGMSVLAYSRGRFPTMAAIDLPLGYKSGVGATKVANAVYAKFMPGELADTQPMFFHAHGPGLLHTAKKPVKTLADMKGLKIRATGNSGKLVNALGGSAVAQSMSDAYQAIQKGVVDGGMYPVETNKGWKMAEVVDYQTQTFAVAYSTTFFVVMNKDKWASIPAAAQKTIMKINEEFVAKHGQAWDDSDKLGQEAFEAKGGKVIALSDTEAAKFVAAAAPMMDGYIKSANEKGLDGKAILDFTVDTLKKAE